MKNDDLTSDNSTTQDQTMGIQFNSQQIKVKCQGDNKIDKACLNPQCKVYAFICQKKKCKCRQNHKKCCFIQIDSLYDNIKSKIISLNPLVQLIDKTIQKQIDHLSNVRDKHFQFIRKYSRLYGLSANEQLFIHNLNARNAHQLNGKTIKNIIDHIHMKNNCSNIVKNLEQGIKQITNQLNLQVNLFSQGLNFNLQKLIINQIQQKNIKNTQVFIDSQIIINQQGKQNILNFFQDKIVKNTTLLFKASQHQFKIQKFHDKCDNIPHTLTIVETQFGKILGGYTPLTWCISQKNQYITDESGSSFIFSLTNNHKFKLIRKQYAIKRFNVRNCGPQFGKGANFWIAPNSNTQKTKCGFNIANKYYMNQNYTTNDIQTCKKLNGDTEGSHKFQIKKWQVWKIDFQN